jgi:hypothetical protein
LPFGEASGDVAKLVRNLKRLNLKNGTLNNVSVCSPMTAPPVSRAAAPLR